MTKVGVMHHWRVLEWDSELSEAQLKAIVCGYTWLASLK